ncbi:Lysophospholipid acyltransferase [Coemansia sp. Benny D115]|nr:Lysophospholipid acyltransferase [Coemansia sp. Benny D115]
MQWLDQQLDSLSQAYLGGIAVDRVATVVSVLLSYLLSLVYQRIPVSRPQIRHMYSMISTLVLFGMVQSQILGLVHLGVGSLIVYTVVCLLDARSRMMPLIVFLLAMVHLSFSQLRRQRHETEGQVDFDYTGAQMIFVIKVTSLAFCIHDGTLKREEMSSYQRSNALDGVPGITEYLGYVFFFPGFAVGPAFEMAAYRRMVAFDIDSTGIGRVQKRQINGRAVGALLAGVFWMVFYVLVGGRVSFMQCVSSPAFLQRGPLGRSLWMMAAGLSARSAYYAAWKLSEGACVLAGLGFQGVDAEGKVQWSSVANVHIWGVEFGTSLKQLVDSWNVGTNTWLRHHVYLRLVPKGSGRAQGWATVVTFCVSAWWHGFYPGYYLTFVCGALASTAARTLRRTLRPRALALAGDAGSWVMPVYNAAGWLLSVYSLNFIAAPFIVLGWQESLMVWRNNYFALPMGIVVVQVLLGGALKKKKQL